LRNLRSATASQPPRRTALQSNPPWVQVVIALNYELALPKTIRFRTNVFYIFLFKLVPKNAKLDTLVVIEDFEEEFKIKTILNFKVSQGKLEYLVKWEGEP
jgi:hypothetical protein